MSTKTYLRFREIGMNPQAALRATKILARWNELGGDSVRLIAEPEMENYFDVYGEPDAYVSIHGRRVSAEQARKEQEEIIERYGCWSVSSQYFDGEKWQWADNVGMHTGYKDVLSPFENWYVVDLMESALDHTPEYAI